MKEIIFMYNSEQSEKIFGQHQYKLSESIRRIKKIVEDSISIEINTGDKLKTNRAIARELIKEPSQLNKEVIMYDEFKREVIKVQAGLNFFFEKVAPLQEKKITKPEELVCDGICGPKTSKAIRDFKEMVGDSEKGNINENIDCQKLFDMNKYYCKVNSDFTYISQRESKYPNQLCSVASLCMILDGFGYRISVDDLNNFIDSDKELAAAAIAMGFKKYVELKKIEQITAIMVMVLEVFEINARMVYLTKEDIIQEMHTKQGNPNTKRIIFATSLTQSGHYVVGNYIFKKFANKKDFEISIYDPFGNWFSGYKDISGKQFFPFQTFLSHCKTDGDNNKYRCIVIQ